MHLKKIEMQGFKSFADKTVLEFMPGITTVIGPNGSGKSNISDAIRWVLGEQSMKSLRGIKSEDIIFAGTQNRKSLGFAEVSIIIDNSDGKLPIEYNEVTVTRKIYRSGETGYFINKTPCRLKDILELFMDTGIGKDGYSIIGQGKIDEILSNKSEDRRHIFEEAAGIVKYRVRKMESEKKLEQTKLNLLRISDIVAEIEANIEPLGKQAEKAKQYLNLREELKSIEIGLFLHNIDGIKERLEETKKDEEIFANNEQEEQKKLEEIQAIKTEIKEKIDNITNEIERMQNIGFESSNQIEKINSNINVSQERIANNEQNVANYKEDIEVQKQKIVNLEEEKENKLSKKNDLYGNKEKFTKELEEKEAELSKIIEKLSSKELEIECKKQNVENFTNIKYEIMSDINLKKANIENIQKREKVIQDEKLTTISELDSLRITKEEMSKAFQEIENKKKNITKELEEKQTIKNTSEAKIKEYEDNTNALLSESRMKDSKVKFLKETEREKEGYTRSVKALLLECEKNEILKKGVHDILANLIKVPKEYETAIEMCLGMSLQNIVTDKEEDAKRLVEYLRNNNLGRASFLPISSVKGKKIDRLINNNSKGVIGIASDLIKYDKKYEQIVLNLLGKTLIVEDMDTAISLAKQNAYSFKIVTLKGDIINPSGMITGGSVTTKTVNILGRTRQIEELEKDLKQINEKLKKIEEEKDKYIEQNIAIIEQVETLQKEAQQIDIIYATEEQKMLSIQENIAKAEQKLNKLKEEDERLKEEKQHNELEEKEQSSKIVELEQQIESLNIEINEYVSLNKDNQQYIDDLNLDITNLKISVSSFDESEISIDEMISRIEIDIDNIKKIITTREEQINTILVDNKDLEEQIVEFNKQIETIKEEVMQSGTTIEKLKLDRKEQNENLAQYEEDIISKMKTIEDIKGHIIKIGIKKSKFEQDLEQIINKMWEEYELTPNNVGEYTKPQNVANTTKQVNALRNQIKDLGSINIDAIEEYKKIKDRYDFMCEQRLDLETSISKLKKLIAEITTTMKDKFREQFKVINKNFNEVFTQLFNGGKAELMLTDEENILECGIDIQVQPPGKKLQNMMLLSGGEKAFTAIALLFAILKINPSPICVLDEIEAALDEVNVYRFAEYLKKYTNNTQFLIITHRKGTMQAADSVYGITMEENGISKLLSMKLK